MKVCLIVPHFLPHIGGGEQLYYDIAKGLLEAGHEVRVVSSNSGGVTGHVPYEGIDSYYYDWKIRFGHPVVRKHDLIEHVKWADIVHTTMFTPATKSRQLAGKYHKPCVITVHEVIGDKWYWFVPSKLKAFAFKNYEKFICRQRFSAVHVVSESTKKDFEKYIGTRGGLYRVYNSSHMPNPVEYLNRSITFQKCFGLELGEKGILYFGRPAVNKGVFVLEEAIHILYERGEIPSGWYFCWVLANQPDRERKKLLSLIESHGLDSVIRIVPSLNRMDLFKVISGADYVVVPSITEGFGFCAVETCSLKRPVIFSDGGSLPEVVFGKTLPFRNRDANDLADKFEAVFQEQEEAFTMIPEKSFEEKRMVRGIIEMYEKVLVDYKL